MPEKYRKKCEAIIIELLSWVVLDEQDGWATALATIATAIDSIGELTGQDSIEIMEMLLEKAKEVHEEEV